MFSLFGTILEMCRNYDSFQVLENIINLTVELQGAVSYLLENIAKF